MLSGYNVGCVIASLCYLGCAGLLHGYVQVRTDLCVIGIEIEGS
jgi:hypothetical protein